ncbi:MAG: hypothetical protein KDD72_03435 [Anaerolineales bacterium]|nr:hypothetical protein [Anaerolineales bacterium]
MKKSLWAFLSILVLTSTIVSCGPAALQSDNVGGTWTTNVGIVNFVQNGSNITGAIEGYGGGRNDTFTGTINESGEAVFSTDWFGDFTLVFSENVFKTRSNDLMFCGIRGEKDLPDWCGFSGKWSVPSKSVFPAGSYMILKQSGDKVTGDLFDGNGNNYDSFAGVVEWGKGWRANGVSSQRGELSLWMNASETGFQFMYGSTGNQQELCALREGYTSAYISSFTCEP